MAMVLRSPSKRLNLLEMLQSPIALVEVGAEHRGFQAAAVARSLVRVLPGASMVKLRISPLIRVPVSGSKPGRR
jgi:hypothetical protein